MASSPRFKVYSKTGLYLAACKRPEDAAAIVSLHGPGATIRAGHTRRAVVWTEGVDGIASDSYDHTAMLVFERAGGWRE